MLENFKKESPIYKQLMNQIKSEILSGVYGEGQKLPSIRSIAKDRGVNPGTVQRALVELENEGLIYRKMMERFVI